MINFLKFWYWKIYYYFNTFQNNQSKDVTISHPMNQSCVFNINIPGHQPRTDSNLFVQTRKHLIQDLDTPCWVCGSKNNRQIHHFILEWSLANACDWTKLKLDYPDFPAWDKIDPTNPDTFFNFVDHPFNMRVLCQNHHTGTNKNNEGYGIHYVPFPIWLFQKYVKNDFQYLQPANMKDLSTPEFVDDMS